MQNGRVELKIKKVVSEIVELRQFSSQQTFFYHQMLKPKLISGIKRVHVKLVFNADNIKASKIQAGYIILTNGS